LPGKILKGKNMRPKFETQRLILRKPRMNDAQRIKDIFGDIRILRNIVPAPYPYQLKDAKKFIEGQIKKWEKSDYLFLLELKSEKKIIGAMGLHDINNFSGKAETGSWIGMKYQKKGYITEAKIAVNDFAFNKLKLRKLVSPVFSGNKASNATQKRIGYKLEGRLRKNDKCKATGKTHDTNLYGLLKEDWKKISPKLKKQLKEKIKKLGKNSK